MPLTGDSDSFKFSAFRLMLLSRFLFRSCCFLCLDCHQLLTRERVPSPYYTGIPLEAKTDQHKSLQIPEKICSNTVALLFIQINMPECVFDITVNTFALKKNCNMSQAFNILFKDFGISLLQHFPTVSRSFILCTTFCERMVSALPHCLFQQFY